MNFLLAHDTIYRKAVVAVTPEACWKTANLQHQCGNNKMEKDGTTYKYLHEATGEGKWLTTQRFTILNCFTQEITLYREEANGPILSPFGILTNETKVNYAFHNDLTIVWNKDKATRDPCIIEPIHGGMGEAITQPNKKTRLIDNGNQLEFHYKKEMMNVCGLSGVYAIHGLPDTYIYATAEKPKTQQKRSIETEETTKNEDYDDTQEQRLNPARLATSLDMIPILYYGLIRSRKDTKKCIRAEMNKIKLAFCHNELNRLDPDAQLKAQMDFAFLSNLVLKTFNGHKCVDGNQLISCYDIAGKPKYPIVMYDPEKQQLRFPDRENKCLQADIQKQQVSIELCIEGDEGQQWVFEHRVLGDEKRIIDFPYAYESDVPPVRTATEPTRKVQTTTSNSTVTENNPENTSSSTTPATKTTKPKGTPRPVTESTGFHILSNITEEDLRILKQEHRQYVDHRLNENLNTLAEEVKEVYCQDLEIKKFQTLLLAQANGLLAARALGLGLCERIESSGMTLILQKCPMDSIAITAKKTQCGYQPYFENQNNMSYTIGKDGWSLHPFLDCFWTGPYVNLNDHTYTYVNGTWTREKPTIHFNKLKIVQRFEQLPANELDFAPRHHSAFDTHSLEQLNVFSELLSRVQESNSESLSDLVMDVQSKNNIWDLTGWMSYIKYGILGVACLIVFILILTVIIKFRAAIGLGFSKLIPQKWRKKKDEEPETMIPMMPPTYTNATAPINTPHDHSDTLFVNGKLYWKDMCPIEPFSQ